MQSHQTTCPRCGFEVTASSGSTLCARCAQTTAAAVTTAGEFAVPDQLGSVRLGARIGRGAAGVVYRGYDQVLERAVAVKFLVGLAGSGRERSFLDEARAAAAVRHPNLVQIYQAAVAGDVPYLVLEYVPGVTLSLLVRESGELSPPEMLTVLSETAAAVGALHEQGILHRDLKPSNVMLDREGHVRVADLGLSLHRPGAAGTTVEAPLAGTPAYMAPEVFDGRVSVRSDIYALGMIVFELLACRVPFEGTLDELRQKHEHEPLPAAILAERGVPPVIVEVIERATHKQPPFRYKTAADLERALARAVGEADVDRARRSLSLRVARCGGGAPATRPADELASPSSYAQAMDSLLESKRQRRTTETPAFPVEGSSSPSAVDYIAPIAATGPDEADAAPPHGGHLPPMQYISRENKAAVFASLRRSAPPPLIQIALGLLLVLLEFAGVLGALDLAGLMSRRLDPVPRRIVEIAAALIVGAAVIVVPVQVASRRLRRRLLAALRQRGLCLECGYDVSKTVSGVCPECGTPLRGNLRP